MGTRNRLGSSFARNTTHNLALALTYIVTARLGQMLSIAPGNVTPVWIPSGIILALLIKKGYYLWPGIFAGAFLGNIQAYLNFATFDNWLPALFSGTANGVGDVLCALLGAGAIARFGNARVPFRSSRSMAVFIVFGAVLGTGISALFGIGSLVGSGLMDKNKLLTGLATWWVGDAVGVLLVTPLLLEWRGLRKLIIGVKRGQARKLAYLIALIGSVFLYLGLPARLLPVDIPGLAVLPVLIWGVFGFRQYWIFVSVNLVALISILSVVFGLAPPAFGITGDQNQVFTQLQLFVLLTAITVFMLSSLVAERDQAARQLRRFQHKLSGMVEERTASLRREVENHRRTSGRLRVETEKAREAARLKSAILANISHEIRTPIQAIIGYSELARLDQVEQSGREQKKNLKIIQDAGFLLLDIINSVLDLSRLESGRSRVDNIAYSPGEILDRLETSAQVMVDKSGHQLRLKSVQGPGLDPLLAGDPTKILQIFHNLISNAIKFTEKGSIEYGLKRTGDRLLLFVRDTGPGISSEARRRVFEPFEQGEEPDSRFFGGTGLGLAITRKLVDVLQGEIQLESVTGPEHGTRVEVYLPYQVASATGEVMAPAPYRSEDMATGQDILRQKATGQTILLVDDDPYCQTLVEKFLALDAPGLRVLMAANGEEADHLLTTERIDLVLVDRQLPGKSGLEITRQIRRREVEQSRPHCPVIMLSAAILAENREQALGAGCDDFISKPFKRRELAQCLADYLPARP